MSDEKKKEYAAGHTPAHDLHIDLFCWICRRRIPPVKMACINAFYMVGDVRQQRVLENYGKALPRTCSADVLIHLDESLAQFHKQDIAAK